MNTLTSSVYSAAFALFAFSAGVLRVDPARGTRTYRFLQAFLLMEGLGFLFETLMNLPAMPLKAVWLGLRMSSALFLAPLLWLAIRERVEGTAPRLDSIGGWERAVIALGCVLTFPLLRRAHFGTGYYNPGHDAGPIESIFIHTTMLLCVAVFAIQAPVYVSRCWQLLEDDVEAEWLRLPVWVVLTTWVLGVVRTLQCALLPTLPSYPLFFAVMEVSLTAAAVVMMFRRTLPAVGSASRAAPTVGRYARSELSPELRARVRAKLNEALSSRQLFRDGLLSLRRLSAAIAEKAHHVSQVISQDLGSTFNDLVNHHRIEEAKRQLELEPDKSVLAISMDVGFNSKSTFNSAFRRFTGVTPTEYRKRT